MADITHGRWVERKSQIELGRMNTYRTSQTVRSYNRTATPPQKAHAIHPATIFLSIMLCSLVAPAAILLWAISQASLNLIN